MPDPRQNIHGHRRRYVVTALLVAFVVMTIGAALGHAAPSATHLPFRLAAGMGRFRPGPGAAIAVGALAGLLVVLAVFSVLTLVRRSRRRSAPAHPTLADELGISELGHVTEFDPADGAPALRGPLTASSQPFTQLRQAVDFANLRHDARSIMITSASRGEGRSATIASLAVAFGRTGRRVALVDLDVRRPAVHGLFGIHQTPGVCELVHGQATLAQSLRSVPLGADIPLLSAVDSPPLTPPGNLYLLPAGDLGTEPPGRVLNSQRLEELLSFLDSYFDLVLIDAPAAGSASAASSLTSVVGGVLVLVGGRLEPGARRSQLKHALETIPAPKLGMIMAPAAS